MPKSPSPKLAYVKWLDACYREGEHALEDLGTGTELEYYGVLVKETPEVITLALEVPQNGRTRNPFDIVRKNILELKLRDAKGVFRSPRKQKERKEKENGRTPPPEVSL